MINLSTGAFYERSTTQIGSLRARAEGLQKQIGSGERLEKSSDDPVAAARLRMLDREERITAVDTRNSDAAENNLKFADQALSQVSTMISRARELALFAANATTSDDQRVSIATELDGLRQSLLGIANGRNASGHSLFGGQAVGNAYDVDAGTGAVTYVGTATLDEVEIGEGQSITPGNTGPEVFSFDDGAGGQTDIFAQLATLSAALRSGGDAAADAARDGLSILDTGFDKVTTAQTVLGSRMAWLEVMTERRTDNLERIQDERTSVGGADLAVTMSRLQEMLTVLEASQSSFVRLANLNLFSMLR
ncbi:MAG: flagellar hook-associated protein 3 [Erythrobacter sp.]|nr:flagellar hook-associated protein 3 [Erythrobacter sp.]NCQ63068.1 flagellar hook-associated protein 3 [Alphaproteobacteria bacterium]